MKVNNPLKMNDWNFKSFIRFVILIQVLVLVITALELNNVNIPILSQFIPFIYLTFIPGFLILRTLKIHDHSVIETIIFAVGLSIFSLMFIGFALNMVLPVYGFLNPISTIPLIIALSIFVVLLCILSYIVDKDYPKTSFLDTNDFFFSLLYSYYFV